MTEENAENQPATTKGETALDVASFVSSAVPWIGGPVSNVLSGVSVGRKLARIREALEGVVEDIKELHSDSSEEYVKTDEFQELLEQSLRRVADERHEEKRRLYGKFLSAAIVRPGEPYDEQIRFLRDLERLQLDQIAVISAINAAPDADPGMMGSPRQTLTKRLPQIPADRIEDLVQQLNDLRILNLTSMRAMMTGHGAQNLQHSVTDYGRRFLGFLVAE